FSGQAVFPPPKDRALSGQTQTHSSQLTQSSGRGSQGSGPAISRHAVGQLLTQSPQLVQRMGSSSGSSLMSGIAHYSRSAGLGDTPVAASVGSSPSHFPEAMAASI